MFLFFLYLFFDWIFNINKVFGIRCCGHLDFLIVFIYIIVIMFFLLIIVTGIIFFSNIPIVIFSIKLININFFRDLEIIINIWNFLFLIIVLIIRLSVLFFSFSYIANYPLINFVIIYLLFVFRMSWLILNSNFYWIILGWDGLGVVSSSLIIFYINYERVTNGLFTIFQNRVGDLFFVFYLLFSFQIEISLSLLVKSGIIILLLGAIVKRAQFPFNAWLLAAIRAPTPISSLVHSSTLVVAGVYILMQYRYCLVEVFSYLKYISLITLIISSFGLLIEFDIKKLIAYSTINHVGLIIFLIRIGLIKVSYFHLNIHAIFKSLIFICFGFTMLYSFHAQDRRLTSFLFLNPVIKMTYNFACLSLIGLPFLTGFFSKDFIIEKSIEFSVEMRNIFLLLIFLSIRIYYSFKLLSLYKVSYVLTIIEFHTVGILSLLIMTIVRVILINLFIQLIFRVSLELIEFKFFIYLLILMFFLLALLTNINLKLNFYVKSLNFIELWSFNWYYLDQYVYWVLNLSVFYVSYMTKIKFVILLNWWVIVIFIFFIYNESFKSVALKKLRVCYNFLRCIACIIFVNKDLDKDFTVDFQNLRLFCGFKLIKLRDSYPWYFSIILDKIKIIKKKIQKNFILFWLIACQQLRLYE